MRIGVVRETAPGERRVALVPETVARLAKSGNEVVVERGAGVASSFPDRLYTDAGATIGDAWSAELVLKVAKPSDDEIGRMREGAVLIAVLQPLTNQALGQELARRRVTALSMDDSGQPCEMSLWSLRQAPSLHLRRSGSSATHRTSDRASSVEVRSSRLAALHLAHRERCRRLFPLGLAPGPERPGPRARPT